MEIDGFEIVSSPFFFKCIPGNVRAGQSFTSIMFDAAYTTGNAERLRMEN